MAWVKVFLVGVNAISSCVALLSNEHLNCDGALTPRSPSITTKNVQGPPANMIFSPDRRFLVVDFYGFERKVFHVNRQELVEHSNWKNTNSTSRCMCFFYDNKTFAYRDRDGSRFNFSLAISFAQIGKDKLHKLPITFAPEAGTNTLSKPVFAISPNGKWLVYGSVKGGHLKLWSFPFDQEKAPTQLDGHPTGINGITVSRDSSLIASCGYDYNVRLWKLPAEGRNPLRTIPLTRLPDGEILSCLDLSISDRNRYITVITTLPGHFAVEILKYDRKLKTSKTIKIRTTNADNRFKEGVILEKHNAVILGDEGGWCRMIDLTTGKDRYLWKFGSRITSIAKTDDERLVAIGTWDEHVRLINLGDSKK